MRELINIIRRLPAALQPVGLLQVSLSLQPLPSLRSVQWPASPPFVSLAQKKSLSKYIFDVNNVHLPAVRLHNANMMI